MNATVTQLTASSEDINSPLTRELISLSGNTNPSGIADKKPSRYTLARNVAYNTKFC